MSLPVNPITRLRPRKPLVSTENIIKVEPKLKPRRPNNEEKQRVEREKVRQRDKNENLEYNNYLKMREIIGVDNFVWCKERKINDLISKYNIIIQICNRSDAAKAAQLKVDEWAKEFDEMYCGGNLLKSCTIRLAIENDRAYFNSVPGDSHGMTYYFPQLK